MITQNSISSAAPIVNKLIENRINAVPLQGSMLEQLCIIKEPAKMLEGDEAPCHDVCDTIEHKETLNYVSDISAKAVQNLLYNTKNVAVPLIQQTVDQYSKYVDAAIVSTNNNLLVKPYFQNDIWNNPVILSMVEKYDGVPVNKVPLNTKFPSKSSEELKELIKTGSERFDAEVADYLDKASAELGYDLLVDVYQTVFSFDNNKGIVFLDDYINPFNGNREAALVTLLLANRLLVEIPDDVQMALEFYRAYVTGIVEQSGRAVMRVIQILESDIKNKSLIITYPNAELGNPFVESIISVNGKVYKNWLEEGGSPEVLFGAAVSDKNRDYNGLLSDKENYIKTWEREKRIIDSKVRFELKNVKTTALRKAFYDSISSLPEDQKRMTNVDMVNLSNDIIDNALDADFDNVYLMCKKLICRSVFPETDYEKLLTAIDAAADAHKGIDPREAALLATIEYVADWVSSQIQCVKY